MAHRWVIQILRANYKPEFKPPYRVGFGESDVVYQKTVLGDTRLQALENSLAAMKSEQHKLNGKYCSVWVGTRDPSSLPTRLNSIQIVIETWTIRDVSAERRGRARHQEVMRDDTHLYSESGLGRIRENVHRG